MPKAKVKAHAKSRLIKAKPLTSALPAGYKVIGRARAWDPESEKVIKGVRGESHTVIFNQGTKNQREQRNDQPHRSMQGNQAE